MPSGKLSGNRGPFEIDYDAILWSDPFRRLADKTQVFPLPKDDHVHSRMAHSLEVASVGRTVGGIVGKQLNRANIISELSAVDVGQIVSAACLAHDIGNPPFGHFGEDSIGQWIIDNQHKLQPSGTDRLRLEDDEFDELARFEGNALGFRILVRHQQPKEGGLRLTYATLAAGAKYPVPRSWGWNKDIVHRKKSGFFKSEKELFAEVAKATGLHEDGEGWKRHPLAWLVEAADDIVNAVIDLEDGVRMNAIAIKDAKELLRPIAARGKGFLEREPRYQEIGEAGHLAALRSRAIGILANDVSNIFMNNRKNIENGTHKESLLELSQSWREVQSLKTSVETHCFSHRDVLDIEIAGDRIIRSLLDELMEAAIFRPDLKRSKKVRASFDFKLSKDALTNRYLATLEVLEFVAGMTDRYAVRSYRRLVGVELPGRTG